MRKMGGLSWRGGDDEDEDEDEFEDEVENRSEGGEH